MKNKSRTLLMVTIPLAVAVATLLVMQSRPTAPDFSQYEAGPERKQAFFGYFLPIVQARNQDILELRAELLELQQRESLDRSDISELVEVAGEYGMKEFDPEQPAHWDTLLRRVDIVPPSLALAQAANESAWGTSRFAREGNNFFGQWCFEPGCGIVPNSRDKGKTHEVANFSDPEESVAAYIANLNRNSAYRHLRKIRQDLREQGEDPSGIDLAGGLIKYSERGPEYIKELRSMIKYNDLHEYDALAMLPTDSPRG